MYQFENIVTKMYFVCILQNVVFLGSGMPVFCSLIAFRGGTRFSAQCLGRELFGGNLVNFLYVFGCWVGFGFWKV